MRCCIWLWSHSLRRLHLKTNAPSSFPNYRCKAAMKARSRHVEMCSSTNVKSLGLSFFVLLGLCKATRTAHTVSFKLNNLVLQGALWVFTGVSPGWMFVDTHQDPLLYWKTSHCYTVDNFCVCTWHQWPWSNVYWLFIKGWKYLYSSREMQSGAGGNSKSLSPVSSNQTVRCCGAGGGGNCDVDLVF